MTREELEKKISDLQEEGYSYRMSETMNLIDAYVAGQRRVIHAPKLKWDDQGTMLRAKIFNHQFSVVLRTYYSVTTWDADVFGTPIRLTEKFDPEDRAGAIAFCEAHWESIWEKEVGVPAADLEKEVMKLKRDLELEEQLVAHMTKLAERDLAELKELREAKFKAELGLAVATSNMKRLLYEIDLLKKQCSYEHSGTSFRQVVSDFCDKALKIPQPGKTKQKIEKT